MICHIRCKISLTSFEVELYWAEFVLITGWKWFIFRSDKRTRVSHKLVPKYFHTGAVLPLPCKSGATTLETTLFGLNFSQSPQNIYNYNGLRTFGCKNQPISVTRQCKCILFMIRKQFFSWSNSPFIQVNFYFLSVHCVISMTVEEIYINTITHFIAYSRSVISEKGFI